MGVDIDRRRSVIGKKEPDASHNITIGLVFQHLFGSKKAKISGKIS